MLIKKKEAYRCKPLLKQRKKNYKLVTFCLYSFIKSTKS